LLFQGIDTDDFDDRINTVDASKNDHQTVDNIDINPIVKKIGKNFETENGSSTRNFHIVSKIADSMLPKAIEEKFNNSIKNQFMHNLTDKKSRAATKGIIDAAIGNNIFAKNDLIDSMASKLNNTTLNDFSDTTPIDKIISVIKDTVSNNFKNSNLNDLIDDVSIDKITPVHNVTDLIDAAPIDLDNSAFNDLIDAPPNDIIDTRDRFINISLMENFSLLGIS